MTKKRLFGKSYFASITKPLFNNSVKDPHSLIRCKEVDKIRQYGEG